MYSSLHNHTAIGSNIRGFLDSINRVEDMIDYARELGMPALCFTDHETLTSHIDALHYLRDKRKDDPETWNNFKVLCGNEIYLTSRKHIQEEKDYSTLFHFILIAKDLIGYQQLRELSTIAWTENFFTYVNPRTPTFFDDLFRILEENPGHLIGSTACLGGQLDKLILSEKESGTFPTAEKFILELKNKFGEGNFFLEMQPSEQEEQVFVNKAIIKLSQKTGVPYIITTDSHYLKKEDREVHKYFLLSDDNGSSTREVDDFYATTYLMSEQEIHDYMDKHIGAEAVNLGLYNTLAIVQQCEEYSLDKPLDIPYKAFDKTEPNELLYQKYVKDIPLLKYFFESVHDCDRHMCRDILNKIEERPEEFQNQQTYDALQDCLNALIVSSEAQHTQWSGYLLVCKELIKTVWESESLCGPGRGSGVGFLILYMLDITQVNPLREDTQTFYWRFLHEKRASVLDIDFDSEGSKKDIIIENLRKKYGGYNHVTKVQTIGTAKSKKALQIAARALGYTPEEGVYIASFIQADRGILYTLSQTYYGDPENDIPPNTEFKNLMDSKYPDVWRIAQKIEGLPVSCGSHAGGLILSVNKLSDSCPLMRTRSGDIITQVDLHKAEDMGLIKYDVLNIDALEKIHQELNLLLKDGLIEWQGDLKSTYEKYLGVYNIERNNPQIWEMINNHEILSLFQWEKSSGWDCIEKGKPKNLVELTALNSVMRLMPQPGQTETPLDIYSKHMKDIKTWFKEMSDFGLNQEEQEVVKKYALESYGLLPSQESFMIAIQDPALGGWDLIFADKLRKAVAKKKPKDFIELERQFFERAKEQKLSIKLCQYIWNLVSMSRGYSFNNSHVLAYSIIALQEANLAYHYPIIYWNCANLISDSGGEDGAVNYGKIATAVSRMREAGIMIVPPYINEALFGFKPDAKNNKIIYGLKAINGVGASQANAIVASRPYSSLQDFYEKLTLLKKDSDFSFGESTMISLIKAGAFDDLENKPREEIMQDFIKTLSKPIKKLSMSNIEDLHKLGLLTPEQENQEYHYYLFKKFLYQDKFLIEKAGKSPATFYYELVNKKAENYFYTVFENKMVENKDYKYTATGNIAIKRGSLDKIVDKFCEDFITNTLNNNSNLQAINDNKFKEVWAEKASGTISHWEMESMNYYYHDHELENINKKKYNIVAFSTLPEEPQIEEERFFNGKIIPRFKLYRICGTVIDKDANHNTVTLLTSNGVVSIKYYKGQFNFYAKDIAEKDNITGKKTVIEKSWFKRGNMLLVTGTRQGEYFIPRQYKDSIYRHSTQLIQSIDELGNIKILSERSQVDEGDKNAIGI